MRYRRVDKGGWMMSEEWMGGWMDVCVGGRVYGWVD